ncbi:DNA-binding protein [Thalassotalea euphylliae]|uniref:DNA-binding protein n=1 Tax=Thalassotalea euphylliae TaxID=1655234 RepID=UPI00363E26AF
MTIKAEIIAIANQIANQGGTPTVAKVKAKLSGAAPLPTIISVLKTWQHQPENTAIPEQTAADTGSQTSDLEEILKRALAPLQQELIEVKTRLVAIEKTLDSRK